METPAKRNIVEYYSARAHCYEDRDISMRRMDIAKLQEICRELIYGQDILEIACGTGIWTEYTANFAKSITAIDINLSMLQVASRRLAKLDNVTFAQMDAFDLSTLKNGFSAGLAGWWISHVDKARIRSFLEGFHRALVPGAVVIIMDDTQATLDDLSFIDGNQNSYTIRTLKDGQKYEIIKNIFDENDIRELFSDFGCNIKVYTLKYHWLLTYRVPPQSTAK